MKQFVLKHIKGIIDYSKWLFRKPSISFNRKPDIMQLIKDKNFYELRQYIPQLNLGKKRLSRLQSLSLLGGGIALGVFASILTGNPLPFLIGLAITFGSEYVFNGTDYAFTNYICSLDSTHFVVVFTDGAGGADQGKAIIGTVSNGDEITYGSKYNYSAGSASGMQNVAALDSTHIVVAYRDSGTDNYGKATIGIVSNGDDIAFGSIYTFNSATTTSIKMDVLDSTHFVATYSDNGNSDYGTAIIGVVSNGDDIAYGSEYVYRSLSIHNTSNVKSLDSTHFVLAFASSSDTYKGTAIIGVVSNGDDIAFGSEYIFNNGITVSQSIAKLDSTHFAISYKDASNSNKGTSIIGVVSNGDDIAYGSEYVFNDATTTEISSISIDSTHFLIAYANSDSDGYAITGTVSNGNELAFGTAYEFNNADTSGVTIGLLDSSHCAIAYTDDGNSSYGTAIIGVLPSPPTVTTQAVTSISGSTAVGNGNVTSEGDDSVTERGICWNTSATPTTANSKATSAGTTGAYTATMTGLTPGGTIYYVRAYATSSLGTSYGSEVTFLSGIQSAETYTVRAYATNSVGTSYGSDVEFIAALQKKTGYRVRAYATNAYGTSYGDTVQVTTGDDAQAGFLFNMI